MSLHGDLRLELLRKRLQSKRELLRLLEKMYSCFVTGNCSSEWMICCAWKGRGKGEREGREEIKGEEGVEGKEEEEES